MAPTTYVVARDIFDSSDDDLLPYQHNLIVAFLGLVVAGLCCVAILYALRRRRNARKEAILPQHSRSANRLTITTTPYDPSTRQQSVYVYNEKRELLANSDSPPPSPVPEIRITFPDEEDTDGRQKSGKVVIVRIGESGSIGMEPVSEEQLPPYQKSDADRYQSLDLDRIGGLQEKTRHA